ncbi:MAG: sugar phosphate nucleotidyltransferase [Patescibacteria group bacterium]|jgi:bifunctional UDP-N-acetylglucosamine pyrophosphorylase/glucosamine-1-phosphate N-acetyltransferase|nr:sugar phosphate nucleotidyltransferase [Patescibacteria group bacterium]
MKLKFSMNVFSNSLKDAGIVILAAGKGTRLNCVDMPKVMIKVGGKPIISYFIETCKKIGFKKDRICLVIGFQKEKLMDYFGDEVSYAVQEEQLGTAHAAYTGIKVLPSFVKRVLVVNGDDSAFYRPETIKNFFANHKKDGNVLSLLTTEIESPVQYGRIIRYQDGRAEIIEKEYLTEEQKKIKEISTGTFCFDRNWFEEIFPRMPKMRKLGEFGLPAAVSMAREMNAPIKFVKLEDPNEWWGVNTKEELEEAERRKNNIK